MEAEEQRLTLQAEQLRARLQLHSAEARLEARRGARGGSEQQAAEVLARLEWSKAAEAERNKAPPSAHGFASPAGCPPGRPGMPGRRSTGCPRSSGSS